MKRVILFLSFICTAIVAVAQPTVLGTQVINGSYVAYDLSTVGAFKQIRLQATSSASSGGRNWEFATGTSGSANYSTNWRPYTGGNTLSANTFIPTSFSNGAKYNTSSGGASGLLPAITANNYYTFNVSNNSSADNVMALLETTFSPVTISAVTRTPSTPITCQAVTINVTASATPSSGEYVFVRYSTDAFTTSTLAIVSFSGTSGTATIPAQASGTTVSYYVFSSNKEIGRAHV